MQLLNILLDKIDEIRWDLTYKIEDFIDKLKNPCTRNPESCRRSNCTCPWVEEISLQRKKKAKSDKKNKKSV